MSGHLPGAEAGGISVLCWRAISPFGVHSPPQQRLNNSKYQIYETVLPLTLNLALVILVTLTLILTLNLVIILLPTLIRDLILALILILAVTLILDLISILALALF